MMIALKALVNFLPFLVKNLNLGQKNGLNNSRLLLLLVGAIVVMAYMLTELDSLQNEKEELLKDKTAKELKIALLEAEAKNYSGYKAINKQFIEKVDSLRERIRELEFENETNIEKITTLSGDLESVKIENQRLVTIIDTNNNEIRELKGIILSMEYRDKL